VAKTPTPKPLAEPVEAKPKAKRRAPGTQKPRVRKYAVRRPKNTITVDKVAQLLRDNAGIRALVADKLQVHRSTVTRFIQAHPELEAIELEVQENLVDLSVAQLVQGIKKGDFQSVRYYLDNKGAMAGFGIQRVEMTGKGGGPIRVAPEYDYSKLTVEELRQMEALAMKALPDQSAA
jgi:hypothetical protein